MKKIILIYFVFLIYISIYFYSMPPAYNCDDSPETTLAYYSLGIQHPPGYPLSTLIGKIFMLIPIGNYMFRANLMSVFFNLLAGFLIFIITKKILLKFGTDNFSNNFISLTSAAFYLFSSSAWLQGIIAKGSIYSLNAFFTSIIFYLLIKNNKKDFYLFAFLYGLSMGNHWTSMVVLFPAIIVYLFLNRNFINIKIIITGFILFIAGFSVYLFIFIRNFTLPIYAWGDTRTLKDFFWLFTRAQYSAIETKHTISHTFELLIFYFKNLLFKEFFPLLILIIIPGVYLAYRKIKEIMLFILISYFSLIISVTSLATPPPKTQWLIKPYLVSSNIFIAILLALSLFIILRKFKKIMLFLFLIIILITIKLNHPDYRYYFIGYDYSKNLIKTATPGSIVISEGDMNIGAVLYETYVNKENFIPFITVVSLYDWYRVQLKRNFPAINLPEKSDITIYLKNLINLNLDKDIFYTNVYNEEWVKDINMLPDGMLLLIYPKNKVFIISDYKFKFYTYRGLFENKVKYDEFTKRLAIENYGMNYFKLANFFMQNKNYLSGLIFFKKGLLFFENDAAMVNAGLCAYYMGNYDEAEKFWKMAIKKNPESTYAYSNLAFIYMVRKDYINAKKMLDYALKANPDNKTAKDLMIQLENIIKNNY